MSWLIYLTRGRSLTGICVIWLCFDEAHGRLPMLYWLPNLHYRPYKSRFIVNFSLCTTTELSILSIFCLTVIRNSVIKIAKKFIRGMLKICFGQLKILMKPSDQDQHCFPLCL